MKAKVSEALLCPMVKSIDVIGGKWKLLLIYYLSTGVQRFSHLQRVLPTITAKMLTQQLRELEKDRLIRRKVYAVIPPKVEYSLTTTGQKLIPILEQLHDWGKALLP